MTASYSGTPLAQKLSFKNGQRVWWQDMPVSVCSEIEEAGLALDLLAMPAAPIDAAHVFVDGRAELEAAIHYLLPLLQPAGFIWVSWPKKSAKVPTDITEDVIRAVALPLGLVDVKVCAVDSTWSGLKLMIRRNRRSMDLKA